MGSVMSSEIETRYELIQKRISDAARKYSRDPKQIQLIAVSKTQPIEAIEALYRLGHRDFAENYAQELVSKALEAKQRGMSDIRWHFIGHLQSNKVKQILPFIYLIHSVDSISLAQEISKRSQSAPTPCLLSVNIDQESSKSGFLPESLKIEFNNLKKLPGIQIRGLMCIPDPEKISSVPNAFSRLRRLGADLQGNNSFELSMGMTGDFEDAIGEGATFIRIGTAIFGERK